MTRRRPRTGAIILVGVLTAAPVAAQAPVTAPAPVTAFLNVSVIPMDRERVLPDQTVLVQGDRITALGPTSGIVIPAGAVRVDGTGRFLMPGLADMHVHLEGGATGWSSPPNIDMAEWLFTFVANGVTTVRDMHSSNPTNNPWMLTLRRRLAAGEVLGPRVYAAGDPAEPSAEVSPAAVAQSVMALKAAGYDFVKVSGLVWSRQPQAYDSLVTVARRVGLPVVGHVPYAIYDTTAHRGVGLQGVLRDRWASTEHLYGYMEYATGLSELNPNGAAMQVVADTTIRRIAREVQQAGVWSCPTLALMMKFFFTNRVGPLPQSALAVHAQFFNPRMVKALQDAGAGLLLGTDALSWDRTLAWGGFAIHAELAALVEAGLTPYQALATGTRNVAQFLGTADSTGTIAVGHRADLVLLKANPLADIHHTTALAGVMVGGLWLPRAELDRRISELSSVPTADDAQYGTVAQEMRVLSRFLWR